MTATAKVKIEPFEVPNLVIVAVKCSPVRTMWLRELDADTLDELCNEFRAAVFRRAAIPDHKRP